MPTAHSGGATTLPVGKSARSCTTPSLLLERIEAMSNIELESLSCSHCGAPIEVPAGTEYVTCAHCGSRLLVRHNDTASYTERLDRIGTDTSHISHDID